MYKYMLPDTLTVRKSILYWFILLILLFTKYPQAIQHKKIQPMYVSEYNVDIRLYDVNPNKASYKGNFQWGFREIFLQLDFI